MALAMAVPSILEAPMAAVVDCGTRVSSEKGDAEAGERGRGSEEAARGKLKKRAGGARRWPAADREERRRKAGRRPPDRTRGRPRREEERTGRDMPLLASLVVFSSSFSFSFASLLVTLDEMKTLTDKIKPFPLRLYKVVIHRYRLVDVDELISTAMLSSTLSTLGDSMLWTC